MRVDQLLGSVIEGDAISWDAVSIRRNLVQAGFESDIYVERQPGAAERTGVPTRPLQELDGRRDALIYHLSVGSDLTSRFLSMPGPRVVRYHNVTPPRFFEGWDPPLVGLMERGRRELEYAAVASDFGLAVSEYNRREMEAAGFARSASLPIAPDLDDLRAEPDPDLSEELARYEEQGPLWLFVGRFVPNKCQADLVRAFAAYKRMAAAGATLVLVGWAFTPSYRDAVLNLASDLGVSGSIVVRGPVSSSELAACYKSASVFVCLSEHEGFCLPLLEAMHFGVPVVAYASAAIPETVGGAAVLLHDKDPVLVAATVDEVLRDSKVRSTLKELGSRRLENFRPEPLAERLRSIVSEVTG